MSVLFWMSTQFDRNTTSEHLLIDIIKSIAKNGEKVHILQKNTGGDKPEIPDRLSSYNITSDSIDSEVRNKSNLFARFYEDIKYALSCRKKINDNFSHVFIQSTNIAWLNVLIIKKKLKNAHITINIQDLFPENAYFAGKINKLGYFLLSKLQNYAYNKVDSIITISEDIKNQLISNGIKSDKIKVIYNWTYENDLDFSDTNFSLYKRDKFSVVYAGNIGQMQNVEILIDVAKMFENKSDVQFYIIGDGVYKEKLVDKVRDYHLNNVSFLPIQSKKNAFNVYRNADINFIPLKKEIFKTALPSKTPICLLANKPIIFAIGEDSIFGKKVAKFNGNFLTESDDVENIAKIITKIKNNNIISNNSDLYNNYFNQNINSDEYAKIILG